MKEYCYDAAKFQRKKENKNKQQLNININYSLLYR